MRALRNIAIIALLALILDVAPGGGNAAAAIQATLGLIFMALIGLACWQLFRQNRLTYASLTDRQRGLFLGAIGAIVLMIAGADELTDTGAGLLVWIVVLAASIFANVRGWMEAQSRY
jgi:peptidoglycan/LPS O-acetylase OafA/YrhL